MTVLMLHIVASASGETLQVTRADDPAPDACLPGDCSLREAVNAGNSMAGRQTIDVPDGMIIDLSTGPVTVTGDMTVAGHGVGTLVTSGLEHQLIVVSATGDLVVQDITLGGVVAGNDVICGAAIQNDGKVQITDAFFQDNFVNGKGAALCNNGTADIDGTLFGDNHAQGGPGGAIYNIGTMTMANSTISHNFSVGVSGGGDGAGISNVTPGTLTVDHSTFADNSSSSQVCEDCSSGAGIKSTGTLMVTYSTFERNGADDSAAIQASGTSTIGYSAIINNNFGSITNLKNGTMTIHNSTVSNNNAGEYPKSGYGGIHNEGFLTVVRSTIADNTAIGYPYGGFYNSNQSVQTVLRSNLISNNGTKSCSNGGNVVSQGGNVMTDDSCKPIAADMVVTDAMIGPLADNGGPTKTRALLQGSPAIDNGSNYQCTLDQRGAPRPVGPTCDAGAFEYGGVAPTPKPTPSPTPAPAAFPMGDTDCNEHVTILDVPAELRLAMGLDQPSDCGRSSIPCLHFNDACFPVWTNPDCNQSVDAADALPILRFLAGDPMTEACGSVGDYPAG